MFFFATTVFLSAFLLFQVQPIMAKMILPWFGGASSVWSVCLVFFQAELLLGYAYVHWMHERLTARRQMVLHGALLLLSLLTLPVVANPAWREQLPDAPSLAVLLVLATTVGAPYLLLSTTGPLMQAWYARSRLLSTSGIQPYRLYALSNLASMLGLLTYPVLVEPMMAVRPQAIAWSTGYVVFVMACLATAAATWRGMYQQSRTETPVHTASAHPAWTECLLWVGLAGTATVLLLSITRHLTQDVAPVPFLWVLPLSLYLLSFILCFDAPRYYVRPLFLGAVPFALWALDHVMTEGTEVPWLITLMCSALFVFCMVCHGELVQRKPPVRHLTLFYLMLSIGGALGGAFVGLLAPAVFDAYHELPIGLLAFALLVMRVLWPQLRRPWRALLLLVVLGYGARLVSISWADVHGYEVVMRNFYSQLRVEVSQDEKLGEVRSMVHGRINHGEQYPDPMHRRQPTAYYCELSGIGRAIRSLPQDRPLRLGVLGLGTGTLAAYGRPGDTMRLYEINEQVLSLARSHFTYLQDSGATIETALGDGRLVLESEPAQRFDLLAMDAFSGDSIPTHLLTLEALQGYLRHLAPGGVLAVHITNHYLDLKPVMASAAQRLERVALSYELAPPADDLYCRPSTWVLLVTPEQAASLPPSLGDGVRLSAPPGFRPWTDSFSNLLGILKD